MHFLRRRDSFTLIELLIVIAIIAVLATVVILALNPAQLLMQARDANRVSDMKTLNQALQLYAEDVGTNMGTSSVIYVSVPDPTATSSAGTDCAGIGLSSANLPSGWTYHCAGPSYYKNVDGTGWIPVDFKAMATGSPIGTLPVDPTNTTSSGLYYTYVVQGDPWELTANMESTKYQAGGSNDVESTDGGQYPDLYEVGSDLSLMPIDYNPSLVGYWKLDEGSGTVAYDSSGHGNNGTWSGTPAGTSGYYSPGHNHNYAGYFDGSTDYVTVNINPTSINSSLTIVAWLNSSFAVASGSGTFFATSPQGGSFTSCGANNALGAGSPFVEFFGSLNYFYIPWGSGNGGTCPVSDTWAQIAFTYDGTSGKWYMNGTLNGYRPSDVAGTVSVNKVVIGNKNYDGLISDVRIYNRALSASEIAAIYNAEK